MTSTPSARFDPVPSLEPTEPVRQGAPGKAAVTSRLAPRPASARDIAQELAAVLGGGSAAAAPVPVAAAPMPVQREATGRGSPLDNPFAIHLIASEGVAGSSSALPHAAAIQASFGHHDVGGVQAHIGGAGADAAHAIGAGAYATGDHVAFAAAPDLRQAAHETAHVVQQRGGVRLDGGIGARGDRYERHADEVADRVVRGESAEALLDTMAHRGSAGGAAVQGDVGDLTALLPGMPMDWSATPAAAGPEQPEPWTDSVPERPPQHGAIGDWRMFRASCVVVQQQWNAVVPAVRRYQLSSDQVDQLRRTYGLRIDGESDLEEAVEAQPAGRAPLANPVAVGALFGGGAAVALDGAAHAGIERASSHVTVEHRAVVAADRATDAAIEAIRGATHEGQGAALALQHALAAGRVVGATRDVVTAQGALQGVRGEMQETHDNIDLVVGLLSDLGSLLAMAPASSLSEAASGASSVGSSSAFGYVVDQLLSDVYRGRIDRAVIEVHRHQRARREGEDEEVFTAIQAAQHEAAATLSHLREAQLLLVTARANRATAYDALGNAAASSSGESSETSAQIRGAVAAIPAVEVILGTGQAMMQGAAGVPEYGDASGRGLAMAFPRPDGPAALGDADAPTPIGLQFLEHLAYLRGYGQQGEAIVARWTTRLASLRAVVDQLSGNGF